MDCLITRPLNFCLAVFCARSFPKGNLVRSGMQPSLSDQHRAAAEKPPKTKRGIAQPRDGFMIENVTAQTVTPIPYDIVKEGIQT